MKLRVSKYTILFLLHYFIIGHIASAQDLSKRISIHCHDEKLKDVLKTISEEGKIHFSYSPQAIPADILISADAKDQTIRNILDEIFKDNGIGYFVLENQVILKMRKKGSPDHPETSPAENKKHTVSGYLKDNRSGENLIGANIFIRGSTIGTTTNAYGFYSLTLPEGEYPLVFSFIGYLSASKEITLVRDTTLSLTLSESLMEIKEIVVVGSGREQEISNGLLSEIRLSPRLLSQLPGFVGDVDVIKALQVIPGIKSYGDGSSLFYVRGGESDQNLLQIDEAPIYNPSHLFGFVSAISPDAINDISAYKGDFPANYGDRLSSVIDVKSKDGNMKRFGFSGNLGPYASNISLEGPLIRDKSSFFISGRKSTLGWLRSISSALESFDISFFDVNAKLNLILNEKNRFYVSFYWGEDMLNRNTTEALQTYGISWNNIVGTLRWNHVFSPRLFSNTTVYYSQYNYYLFTSKELKDYWSSSIANSAFRTDFTWYLNPRNTIRTGVEVSYHYSNPGNVTITDTAVQNNAPSVNKYHSMEYTFYASNEQRIGRKISLRYGLRLPVWQNFGPTTVYSFNTLHQVSDTLNVPGNTTYSTFVKPEPRIHVQYTFNNASSVTASYCRTTQFIQVLSNSTSPFTSLDVWAPSGPNLPPQQADQYTLGYYRKIFHKSFIASGEAFYKRFYNHIDYKDHANMLYNPLIEGEVRIGKAWAYGLELMLRKPEGRFTGWIGYTWSRAIIQTDEINNGKAYPAFYDRPHSVCINLSFVPNPHWTFSANWILMSGGAITTPVGFYYYNGYSVPLYGDKNNDRLPVYHRLDLSVNYTINKPDSRFRHNVILTLYNAYGRYNPFSVNFNKKETGPDEFVVPANLNNVYDLVPTTISVAGIIPSVNYLFRF